MAVAPHADAAGAQAVCAVGCGRAAAMSRASVTMAVSAVQHQVMSAVRCRRRRRGRGGVGAGRRVDTRGDGNGHGGVQCALTYGIYWYSDVNARTIGVGSIYIYIFSGQ